VPDPSIERTRAGRMRNALISLRALSALPARAAHVNRQTTDPGTRTTPSNSTRALRLITAFFTTHSPST